jgi:SAM-dependent methyltransferase
LFARIRNEVDYWLRSEWSFAEVGEHWDETEDYDDINRMTYSYSRRFVDGLRLSKLPSGGRVLDFCARTGNGAAYFFQQGKLDFVVCADVSEKMGQICIQKLHEDGLNKYAWIPIGGYEFPFGDDVFDTVLCFETIEHFPDPEQLLKELGRVTQPGGTLILTTPNVLWEPVHAFAAITGLHHSEGPHRFIRYHRLLGLIRAAGFNIQQVETTVLVPAGPKALISVGEWLEKNLPDSLMRVLGLRRVIIGKKRGSLEG